MKFKKGIPSQRCITVDGQDVSDVLAKNPKWVPPEEPHLSTKKPLLKSLVGDTFDLSFFVATNRGRVNGSFSAIILVTDAVPGGSKRPHFIRYSSC